MDLEQQQEYAALEREALANLRDGGDRSGLGRRLIQFLVIPSFEAVVAYEVFARRGTEDSLELRKRVWDRESDAAKLETPIERLKHPHGKLEPTISDSALTVPRENLTALLEAGRRLRVDAIPGDHGIGTDGTGFEIAFGDLFATSRFCWWQEGPDAWNALRDFGRAMTERLEALLIR